MTIQILPIKLMVQCPICSELSDADLVERDTAMGEVNYCEYLRLKCTGNHDCCPKATYRCITEELCMHLPDTRTSRPAPSPQNDYRDLFVSDLIATIKWDAEHGNPELFKAVNSLKQHYKTFTVEAHDTAIRNHTLIEAMNRIGHAVDKKTLKPKRVFTATQIADILESLRKEHP